MRVLQAMLLSGKNKAELLIGDEQADHTIYRLMPRYRLVAQNTGPVENGSPESCTLTVQHVSYPDRQPAGDWGEPVYTEKKKKTFKHDHELSMFVERLDLPHSWVPVEDEANV